MKTPLTLFKLSILTAIAIFASYKIIANDEYYNTQSKIIDKPALLNIENEIEKRWKKLKSKKSSFAYYSQKSNNDIFQEFDKIKSLRKKLWYRFPDQTPPMMNKDYSISENLTKNGDYSLTSPHLAFAYNCVDHIYNASHILIYGHHFIAMQSPSSNTLNKFFDVLLNQNVSILIRLKPDHEYLSQERTLYWKKCVLHEEEDCQLIEPKIQKKDLTFIGAPIPYFYTELWKDNHALDVTELYSFVEKIRDKYKKITNKGPIACHCSVGVGRTGTLIAAYVLAEMLDVLPPEKISIEALVLKLSIQRPLMVSVKEQYILLYEFVDYYLKQKNQDFCPI
ncbi:MAG: hypothetical protein C5B43_01500 [Verrucomicrobia bacterium]|nr:MAG: hypothetical protein C5B43_01500 [Verrucomicrobiota bacterium]